jgi:hypothetical protein
MSKPFLSVERLFVFHLQTTSHVEMEAHLRREAAAAAEAAIAAERTQVFNFVVHDGVSVQMRYAERNATL